MWVARYSTPPASTVPVAVVTRPDEPEGGARLPWKSLTAKICTFTVPPLAAEAGEMAMTSITTSANKTNKGTKRRNFVTFMYLSST